MSDLAYYDETAGPALGQKLLEVTHNRRTDVEFFCNSKPEDEPLRILLAQKIVAENNLVRK